MSFKKYLFRREFAWVWISGVVYVALLGLRFSGALQRGELAIYDKLIVQNVDHQMRDPRIVICGMNEDDLREYGHPLDDEKMSMLLEKLIAENPCIIGLDIYRDLKEPRSGLFYHKIEHTFLKNEKIIAIERLGYVKPPPALADKPERIAPNNIPRDYKVDDVYRRAYLFMESGLPEPRPSLALALAMEYLAAHDVPIEMQGTELKVGNVLIPRINPSAGAYVGLDIRDYEMLVDYKVRFNRVGDNVESGFRVIRFKDVFESQSPGSLDLAGKIVIVANNLDSVKDANKSPVSEAHWGVFQHAAVINQLLRAGFNGVKPLGWLPESRELALIAIVTALGGVLGLACASPWRLASALGLGLTAIGLLGFLAFRQRLWLPILTPGAGFGTAAIFVTSFLAYAEKMEMGMMKSIFSRHVSSGVVDTLWAERETFMEGGQIRPQRLTATVLFTDLKNFSTTAETMEPSTLLNWMNEFMEAVAPKVEDNGGIINKFIGDAIMAVFGVPVARSLEQEIDRDAVNAVRCALQMQSALRQLNEDWTLRKLPTTSMRVGIHTGALVSGSFGSSSRLEFTVLGDTVNTGARLEAAGKEIAEEGSTPDCVILMSDQTYSRLGGLFEAKLVGPMRLKGKGETVVVYRVLSEIKQEVASLSES